jgi:hypothetical protein
LALGTDRRPGAWTSIDATTGSGERLRFQAGELIGRDRAGIEQTLGVADLVRWRLARQLPDVGLDFTLRPLYCRLLPAGHAGPSGNDVDQRRQERQQDQADDPQSLAEATEFAVAEQIGDDLEHHEQVRDEHEGRKHQPEKIPKVAHGPYCLSVRG